MYAAVGGVVLIVLSVVGTLAFGAPGAAAALMVVLAIVNIVMLVDSGSPRPILLSHPLLATLIVGFGVVVPPTKSVVVSLASATGVALLVSGVALTTLRRLSGGVGV